MTYYFGALRNKTLHFIFICSISYALLYIDPSFCWHWILWGFGGCGGAGKSLLLIKGIKIKIFLLIRESGLTFLPSALKMSLHCFLPFMVHDQKSARLLILVPFCEMCCLLFDWLQDFWLSLDFMLVISPATSVFKWIQ